MDKHPGVTSVNSIENDNTVTLIHSALENIYPTPRQKAVTFIEQSETFDDRKIKIVNR